MMRNTEAASVPSPGSTSDHAEQTGRAARTGPRTAAQTSARPPAARARRSAPGPGLFSTLRTMRELRNDPLRFMTRMADVYGDVVRFRLGPRDTYLVRGPQEVAHVLQTKYSNYGRDTPFHAQLRLALGRGLLTSQGDFWRGQRRVAQPAFRRERLAHSYPFIATHARAMLDQWQKYPDGHAFDVSGAMGAVTLEITGHAFFGTDLAVDSRALRDAVVFGQSYVMDRMSRLVVPPLWLPTPASRRFRRGLSAVDRVIYQELAARRAGADRPDDYLSLLVNAPAGGGGVPLDDELIRDEFFSMLSAGHETTASALTWALYLLSMHPLEAKQVQAEVERVLNGREPTLDDLPHLEYTGMVVKETMRLFPPVPIVGRNAIEDDCIAGYHIPAGSVVLVSAYATHRHPGLWENPEAFDPTRFLPARSAARPRMAYLPFGGGPHTCIGGMFGEAEAHLILAMIVQRFRLHLLPGQPVDLDALVALRPRHGMMMTLHRHSLAAPAQPTEAERCPYGHS